MAQRPGNQTPNTPEVSETELREPKVDELGVLRFDVGDADANLGEVSWDEWFATFDQRRLDVIYQEERRDGAQSNFSGLESPDREDG